MSVDPKKLGAETRSSVLPTTVPSMDFSGPNYDFADELPLPSEVGVYRGNSLSSVVDAGRGVAYYADMIGFGNPSSRFTRNMNPRPSPMGINYFVRTATKCSNGADMWIYVNGIPKGNAFGKRIQRAMRDAGVPGLQGLAPGMIEDVKAGLDPTGVANSIFGSGYVRCKQVTLPVGDNQGRIKGRDGQTWIQSIKPGDIRYDKRTKKPEQTRWVFGSWLTQEDFSKEYEQRVFCPDGSSIVNHEGQDCKKPAIRAEGFQVGSGASESMEVLLPVTLLLGVGALLYVRYRA